MLEMAPLLEVEGLTVDFETQNGTLTAVNDVSFSVSRNESVAIIGESGSGKSVLVNAIFDLIDSPPGHIKRGDIRFEGESLFAMSEQKRRALYGRRMAIVFQDPLVHLNPVYSVGWQICEMCLIHGMSRREAASQAIELLERVGIPDPRRRMHDYPHQFSGGQRQRVMIAMAMALKPDLLIADEPTTALDVTVQAQILDLLRDLRDETGMSLIMITHDLGVAADIADRVLVMRKGQIVERGPIKEVFSAPNHPYTKELLTDRSNDYRSTSETAREVILDVSKLNVCYGSYYAVRDVSFSLAKGEILGIVGESGSGKSTLAAAILRLLSPQSGTVCYRGKDIRALRGSDLKAYNRAVQAVFQDPFSSLNPRMTVLEIISEPWELHPGSVPREARRDRAAELLGMVGLKRSDLARYPSEFSGGQRQRIATARALALEPEIIVCDEAVSALDMTIQAQVIALLAELRLKLGLSYIFIAHDLTLVQKFADRVLVMKDGAVVEEGRAETVFTKPTHDYTRQLIAASPVADPIIQAKRRASRRLLLKEGVSYTSRTTDSNVSQAG